MIQETDNPEDSIIPTSINEDELLNLDFCLAMTDDPVNVKKYNIKILQWSSRNCWSGRTLILSLNNTYVVIQELSSMMTGLNGYI